jgi:fluoride ion exporter CrcB/FEX
VTLGTSLVLAAIGAVLRWAVTAHVNGFNIQTAGLVVFIIGLVGVVLSLFYMLWWTERDRSRPVHDPRYTQPPQPPPY